MPIDQSQSTREPILMAAGDGELLLYLSNVEFDAIDTISVAVADLHNAGEVDVLASFQSDEFQAVPPQFFYKLLHLFRRMFPLIRCDVAVALSTVRTVNTRLQEAGVAASAHDALLEWLKECPTRAEEALSLVRKRSPLDADALQASLVAGGRANPKHFSAQALEFTTHPSEAVRNSAIFALGRVTPLDDDALVPQAIERVSQIAESSDAPHEIRAAVDACLFLLEKDPVRLLPHVEPIIAVISRKRTAPARSALALGLLTYRQSLSATIIDDIFSSVQHTSNSERETIDHIDLVLHQWDIDADRDRVSTFLQGLLTRKENPLLITDLDSFRHRLSQAPGELLGWYVFSLLSSGNDQLGEAAAELLPYKESREGIDIDLSAIFPCAAWIPYLARKVLGYCVLKKECAAGLLLACLRAASVQHRSELEELIFGHFLMNYLDAINYFEDSTRSIDLAKGSVQRLSRRLRSYVSELKRLGTCRSFAPSERERNLQAYRRLDFWQDVQKKAEEHSVLSLIGHKSILLYGSASVVHIRDVDGNTNRKEMRFSEVDHSFEFPRLYVIDPVGFQIAMKRFKSERYPS